MWVSKNYPCAIVYLYMACLFGYVVIESYSYSNPIDLKLADSSVTRVRFRYRINTTQFTPEEFFRLDKSENFTAFGERWPRRYHRIDRYGEDYAFRTILFVAVYPITIRGTIYNYQVRVYLDRQRWAKSVIFKAAPLPHRNFNAFKEGNKVIFHYTPQSGSSHGITSLYAFTKLTCHNDRTSINEESQVWTHNYTDPSTKDRQVSREVVISEDLYGVFKNGSSVSCSVSAVSTTGVYQESSKSSQSFVIAPNIPDVEVDSRGSTRSGEATQVTFSVEINLVNTTFSRIEIKDQTNIYCTLERVEFNSTDGTCTVEFPLAGTFYQLVKEIWSNGQSGNRISVLRNITDLVIKPRSPRSMNVTLVNNEVIISLELESLDINKYDKIYINSSNNPADIEELDSDDQFAQIRWRRILSAGRRLTFNSWTSTIINGNSYTSEITSAYYTTAPSAPLGLTFADHSGGSISFTWRINREEQPEEFTLTVCKVADPDICLTKSLLKKRSEKTGLQIVQKLDEGKNYRAWVQAIANGLESTRSNEVLIHVRVTPKQKEEKRSIGPIIGSVVGVALLITGITVAAVWYKKHKMRWAGQRGRFLDHTGLQQAWRKCLNFKNTQLPDP